jgi:hypothetical protein
VRVPGIGSEGVIGLCLNLDLQISFCSSSLRYKTNIVPFVGGLDVVDRLRPIAFNWKGGGMSDVGLGAEEVAAIEPLLVTYNKEGEVEGVKYDRLTVVLLNAVKEQQVQNDKQNAQIEEQQRQIQQQQVLIEALRSLVCRSNRRAKTCSER